MKIAYILQKMPENHSYSEMNYTAGEGDGYAVRDSNDTLIAYVWFEVNENRANIEMIEVFDKGNGHGTNIVKFLFEHYELTEMSGSVMHDYDAISYFFWLSLGAEINVADEDEFIECCQDGFDVSFDLKKESLER